MTSSAILQQLTNPYFIFGLIMIITAIIFTSRKKKKTPPTKPSRPEENNQVATKYFYQKKNYLLTRNEYYLYKNLKPIADELNLIVCPKVRLGDIIEPKQGQHWKAAFARIQSKHIDFLICKGPLMPTLAIELDDRSHNQQNRIDRDTFVNEALQMASIPILRITGPGNLKEKITDILHIKHETTTI